MQLLVLVLIAGVIGYFVARSKYSKPIDDAAGKVAETSKDATEKARGWWGRRFGKKEGEPVAADAPPAEDGKKPAEKSVSRRKEEATEE
jgi:hypothetical protein